MKCLLNEVGYDLLVLIAKTLRGHAVNNNNDNQNSGTNDSDSIYRAPAADTSVTPKGDLLSIYVGPKNADYYARQFERIERQGSAASWNWPAFFITSIWLLYRKMWLNAFLYWLVLPFLLGVVAALVMSFVGVNAGNLVYYGSYFLISLVLMPMLANFLYYRHAQKKLEKVAATAVSVEAQSAELARIGGTSNVVLIVVPILMIVVVGILAAIAIPAYQDYTVRAQVAEGLNLSAGAKAAVAEHFSATGELAEHNAAAGLSPADSIDGNYVSSVAVDDGNVVITYGNQAHQIISGETLVFTPEIQSGDVFDWACGSPSIEPRHLPAACR